MMLARPVVGWALPANTICTCPLWQQGSMTSALENQVAPLIGRGSAGKSDKQLPLVHCAPVRS